MLLFCCLNPNLYSKYWERITNIPAPYNNNYWLDVYFLPSNPQYGWICGFNGMVLRTTNGGNTWQGTVVSGANHLESVHFPTSTIGYTSGVEGIFKSTDGGANWTNITPTGSSNLWGNFFVDANNGILLGGGCDGVQYFWRTTDGGASWTVYEGNEPNSGLTDAIIYDVNGLGYAVSSGKLWRTTDGGSSWEVFTTSGTNVWQEEICKYGNSFLVPYAGLNCSGQGDDGGMRFTTNNGISWRQYQTRISMFGAFLLDANNGWACGYNRSVYYTSDGGQTWILRNCGVETGNLDDMWFINPSTGWLVGEGVYKLADDRREVSNTILDFGKLCVGDEIVRTFYIRNFSFSGTQVNIQGTGTDISEFSIIPKFTNTINECDSLKVTVVLRPVKAGAKNARISVTFEGGAQQDVLLTANVIQSTIIPEDTLVTINPAYCGLNTNGGLLWRANLSDEYIDTVELVSGSNDIKCISTLPLRVYSNGTRLNFSVTTRDTGWIKARFRVKYYPCNRDTIITVMAYGVSPIITSDTLLSTKIECFSIKDKKIYIPINNTGNYDLNINLVELINPGIVFKKVGWTSGRVEPFKIPANMVDTLIIEYSAKQYGDYTIKIRITNNDSTSVRGRKNPYYITLSGTFNAVDIYPKETIVDFGKVCLGDNKFLTFYLKNKGNIDGSIFIDSSVHPYSDVYNVYFPNENNILRFDSLPCSINFRPKEARSYDDTLYFYNFPCYDTIEVIVKARGVLSKISVIPDKIKEVIATSMTIIKPVKVINIGTEEVTIVDVVLSPMNPDINFSINPKLPQMIRAGDSVIFNFEFYTEKELELEAKICFITNSYCPVDTCIAVNIKSISRRLSFSKSIIDFGFHKCNPMVLYDTLVISNSGLNSDTITRMEIIPNTVPFRLVNAPTLPYIMPGNSKLELIYEFSPLTEGVFEADAVFEAVSKPDEEIKVHLSGEYRTPNTHLYISDIYFGAIEQCDTVQSVTNWLINDGTYDDYIIISKSNHPGFYSFPTDTVIVRAKDSLKVVFYVNPSEIQCTDYPTVVISYYRLKSLVCEDKVFEPLANSIEIIRPKLTISPDKLSFDVGWKGDSATKYIFLENNTKTPKIVTGLELVLPFNDIDINYDVPKVLLPYEKDSIIVHFKAEQEGNYTGEVRIYYESVCKDTATIVINASVPREEYRTKVYIDDYVSRPGDTLTISLNLEYFEPRKIEPERIDYAISFDKWLFFPLEVSLRYNNGFIPVQWDYNDGRVSLTSESFISREILKENGAILNIKGLVLVAVPDSTELKIEEFKIYSEKNVDYIKKNGLLKVTGFCHPTAEMKMILSGIVLSIQNNIILDDNILINYNSPDERVITFKIIDIYGNYHLESRQILSTKEKEINLFISGLSSGIYFILALDNDTQIWYEKILILK